MGHVAFDSQTLSAQDSHQERKIIQKCLSHPIRLRILCLLEKFGPAPQHILAKQLCMSNAALHHHLNCLAELEFVYMSDQIASASGITEKIYSPHLVRWREWKEKLLEEVDFATCLDFAFSWINERHREGSEILKTKPQAFIAGSLTVHASEKEIIDFKHQLQHLCDNFYSKHDKPEKADLPGCAITFAVLPSNDKGVEDSRNILEFEP